MNPLISAALWASLMLVLLVSLASLYSSPSLELGKGTIELPYALSSPLSFSISLSVSLSPSFPPSRSLLCFTQFRIAVADDGHLAEPLDPWGKLELVSVSQEEEREQWVVESTSGVDDLMDDWDWLLGDNEASSEWSSGKDGEWSASEDVEGQDSVGEDGSGDDNGERQCLRVGTMNVRDGAWREPERLEAVIQYLADCQLDALALQELNRWDESLLQERALRWGHNHTQFLHTNSGYHMGFTSSLPFRLVRARTEGFHHGMLHVEFERESGAIPREYVVEEPLGGDPYLFDDVNDEDEEDDIYEVAEDIYESALHMIVTHLDPHDAEMRLSEAHHIDRQGREHRLLLVFGDLNALSPRDREFYQRDHLLTALLSTPELKRKFVYTNYGGEEIIDYRVMERFFVGAHHPPLPLLPHLSSSLCDAHKC